MNVLLLPLVMSILPHQIRLTDNSILTAKIFRAGDVSTGKFLAFNMTEFSLIIININDRLLIIQITINHRLSNDHSHFAYWYFELLYS